MRRQLLLAALVVPVVPVLAAPPAHAADNVICVGSPAGPCGVSAMSISAAVALAESNSVADTILVGPGTYQDGPWELNAVEPITLKGSGEGNTILTLPPSGLQTYLRLDGAHAQDLTVQLETTNSDGDRGIAIYGGGSAQSVTVLGQGTANTTGVTLDGTTLSDANVLLDIDAAPSTRGLYSDGDSVITDTVVAGGQGYIMSGPGKTDQLTRLRITARMEAIGIDGGTVNVDDTLIDLGSSNGTGLSAANPNTGEDDKTINADHVTIVGGGIGSTGALAYAATQAAKQLSAVNLTNSIVVGPHKSLVAEASNDGLQGGSSSAFVNASYSDWDQESAVATIGPNGTAGVVVGAGNVDVSPGFVNTLGGNYRLAASSALVDAGDPTPGGPALDLEGLTRVFDGDVDGTAVRDMGAYERSDLVAPETTFTSGPSGPTGDDTPTFVFTSDPAATFECKVDAGAFAACTSPLTVSPLANGSHTVEVRATDLSANVDQTPAARAFSVDTLAPDSTITKKPAKRVTSKKVKFKFVSNEAGVTFQCKRDAKAYRPCTSPLRWKVKLGKNVLLVRAVDAAGNVDATPARYKFKRIPKTD